MDQNLKRNQCDEELILFHVPTIANVQLLGLAVHVNCLQFTIHLTRQINIALITVANPHAWEEGIYQINYLQD